MELVAEGVPRSAAAVSAGVAALDHETVDHAVEGEPVIEVTRRLLACEIGVLLGAVGEPDEIGHRFRGLVVEEVDLNITVIGVENCLSHWHSFHSSVRMQMCSEPRIEADLMEPFYSASI